MLRQRSSRRAGRCRTRRRSRGGLRRSRRRPLRSSGSITSPPLWRGPSRESEQPMGFWLYMALWLPYTALVIVYGFGSPWYESPIGRAFFLSKLALFLLTTWILSVLEFGRYPWFRE